MLLKNFVRILVNIGDKEIANMATLAGTTREEQKRLVNSEMEGLTDKQQEADVAIKYQDQIKAIEEKVADGNYKAAQLLLKELEMTVRKKEADAKKATAKDPNKLSASELGNSYNQGVADIIWLCV